MQEGKIMHPDEESSNARMFGPRLSQNAGIANPTTNSAQGYDNQANGGQQAPIGETPTTNRATTINQAGLAMGYTNCND